MLDIQLDLAVHRLQADPKHKPVRQKITFNMERYQAIDKNVEKLLKANVIGEVKYTEWVANVILVKNNSGKCRMSVDFTDLNKTCPKDHYPVPDLDFMVYAIVKHALLNFMDAFLGYNEFLMHENDQPSKTFIINKGLYCYKVMPFELKNVGTTYQRLFARPFS